jgi:hypothetical protein
MKTHTTHALAAAALLTLGATGLGAEAATAAGAVGGPIEHYARVSAHSADIYRLRFQAGELAAIDVIGDGDTDLDCFVYDANGHLIDWDEGVTDQCMLRWSPAWTGAFHLHIRNRGQVYNGYVLRTN